MESIKLRQGCYSTPLQVFPENWKDPDASIECTWYIYYRYYDPSYSGTKKWGKLVIKKGMNGYRALAARRSATEILLKDELSLLTYEGYNPVTESYMSSEEYTGDIDSNTPLFLAFRLAYPKLKCGPATTNEIRKALAHFQKAARALKFHLTPISDIRIRNCILILEKIKSTKQWGASGYNHYRSYLLMLFNVIVPLANMSGNPVKNIPKEKEVIKIRKVLNQVERKKVDEFLIANHPTFWRFLQIFFHSGARIEEMLRLTREDVDIQNGRFKVTILKGKQFHEAWKPIKNLSLPLWEEVVKEAYRFIAGKGKCVYLFTKDLRPGFQKISSRQISRRWKKHVKDNSELGNISADFYSLKHLNSTQTKKLLGSQAAAEMNSHTNTEMVDRRYDVERDLRKEEQAEKLKKLNNSFAG